MTVQRLTNAEAIACGVELRNDLSERAAYWRRRAEDWQERSLAIALEEHVETLDALVVYLRSTLRDHDAHELECERIGLQR